MVEVVTRPGATLEGFPEEETSGLVSEGQIYQVKKDNNIPGRTQHVQRVAAWKPVEGGRGKGEGGVFHKVGRMGREQAAKVDWNWNIPRHELYPESPVCVSGERHQRVLTRGAALRSLGHPGMC